MLDNSEALTVILPQLSATFYFIVCSLLVLALLFFMYFLPLFLHLNFEVENFMVEVSLKKTVRGSSRVGVKS